MDKSYTLLRETERSGERQHYVTVSQCLNTCITNVILKNNSSLGIVTYEDKPGELPLKPKPELLLLKEGEEGHYK